VTTSPVAWPAWLFDLLFPCRCVSCGQASESLCASCRRLFRPVGQPRCGRCGAPTAWPVERCLECAGRRLAFASARGAVAYAGPVRPFVAAWKEHGLRHLATLAAELVVAHVEPPVADAIAYIPPDPVRQLERSRHPAESLAGQLARQWGIPAAPLLGRARARPRQVALTLAARRTNARDAFVVRGSVPERVLLVDDVYTTGSTVAAAAAALRAAGARRVDVVTFARALR
jgi:predicted amidophosphoribosyltransferase